MCCGHDPSILECAEVAYHGCQLYLFDVGQRWTAQEEIEDTLKPLLTRAAQGVGDRQRLLLPA
jgi:hypothetical protein